MTKTRPQIEFAHVYDIGASVRTVKAFGYEIPQEFRIRYFVKSEHPNFDVLWGIDLEIEITSEGKPQTRAIGFRGDTARFSHKSGRGVDKYQQVELFSQRQEMGFQPVDFEKVRAITSSARTMKYFQSLAVAVVIHSFDLIEGDWRRKGDSPNVYSEAIKNVEKKFLERKSRVPRSDIDYARVAELYAEAKANKADGYRIREFISANYDEYGAVDIPLDTVNNWIKTCRDRQLIPESNYGKRTGTPETFELISERALIKNISPFGDLRIPSLFQTVKSGETISIPAELLESFISQKDMWQEVLLPPNSQPDLIEGQSNHENSTPKKSVGKAVPQRKRPTTPTKRGEK